MAVKKPDIVKTLAEYDPTVAEMEARTPGFHHRSLMYPHLFDPRQEGSIAQEKAQRVKGYYEKAQKKVEELKEYQKSPRWMQMEALMMMAPELRGLTGTAPLAVRMGSAETSGLNKILKMAEEGKETVKGVPIAEKLRRMFRPKYEGKLWRTAPGESGVGGQFYRAARQPAGEVPQGVKVGWSGGFLEGEADFLAQIEKVAKAKPGEGYKIMKADPVISKYAPQWQNPLAVEPTKTGVYQSRGQEFLAQTIEDSIPWGVIRQKPIAEQRKMFIKFSSGLREFVEHMEGRFKVRIRDLSGSNIGIRADGTPIIWDFGIIQEIGPEFFRQPGGGMWAPRSTREYWGDALDPFARYNFSPAATPNFDVRMAARLGKKKFTSSQLKDPDFWKKLGDKPKEFDLTTEASAPSKIRPALDEPLSEEAADAMTRFLKGGT